MRQLKSIGIILVLLTFSLGLSGCSSSSEQAEEGKEITVSAAASLTESMREIASNYESERGIEVNLNLASSGALQKQIEEGAAVDLFLSAGQSQMDALEDQDLIDSATRVDILENKLVLIVSEEYADTVKEIEDISDVEDRLAIGEVETVPVGQYARESIENQNLWGELEDKMVFAKDVKTVVSYVEKGEVAAGIVYSSDAVDLKSASVAMEIDSTTHRPVVYPAAILKETSNPEGARDLLDYLSSDSGVKVFEKYGFEVR